MNPRDLDSLLEDAINRTSKRVAPPPTAQIEAALKRGTGLRIRRYAFGIVAAAGLLIGGVFTISIQREEPPASDRSSSTGEADPEPRSSPLPEPEGRIVFVALTHRGYDLQAIPAQGGRPTSMTNDADPQYSPAWSPDGKTIAYQGFEGTKAGGHIYITSADGSNVRPVTANGAGPSWSPDGSQLVFTNEQNGGMYVIDANGKNLMRLPEGGGGVDPAWSPTGDRIAFSRGGRVFVMSSAGTNVERITDGKGAAYPAWSPDGTKIAFTQYEEDQADIFVMDADGTDLVRVTDGSSEDFQPDWSPDGSRIVFVRSRQGTAHLYWTGIDHDEVEQLTFGKTNHFSPDWVTDGA